MNTRSVISAAHIYLPIILFLCVPIAVYADDPKSFGEGIERIDTDIVSEDTGLLEALTGEELLMNVILWILGLVAIIALGVIIWGAFMYIVSLGDEKRTTSAKRIILFAVVGLLLVGGAFFIINTVRDLLIG